MKKIMQKAVFFDRDGIFNRAPIGDTHITRKRDFHILEGIEKVVKKVNDQQKLAILISNQSCIERKTLTLAGLHQLTEIIHDYLADFGAILDAVYYCTHLQETDCCCKKPKAGMLLDAAKRFNIDLVNSYMIGDRWFDVNAGKAAGCKTIFLLDRERNTADLEICKPDFIVKNHYEILKII